MKKIISFTILAIALLLNACTNKKLQSFADGASNVVDSIETGEANETEILSTDVLEVEMITESNVTEDQIEDTKQNNETVFSETNIEGDNNIMESDNRTVLVAYFSATGTTKKVAEKIAELTNADLYEIVPKEPYSSADLDWHDKNSRTTKEMNSQSIRPEIASADLDLSGYKTIYLGYPIWWGDAPRIMSTFVEKYKFDDIKVIPFCTSGGSGIGRSGSNLATLAGTGNWSNGERLSGVNSVQSFIDNNK